MLDFRQVLTGAWIRAVANIQDAGEVLMGFVSDPDGGNPITVDSNRQDIYVKVIDTVSNLPVIGRLFAPGNGFWRLPKTNDGVVILRGREAHGPGAPVVLHGDGGYNNAVPSWLGTSDAGVSIPEQLHLESTSNGVLIKSNTGGTVATIQMASAGGITITPAAGQTIALGGNAHPLPLWDTFETAMTTWVTAMQAMINAIVPITGIAVPAQTTAAAACAALLALLSGSFNSTIVKNG